MSSLASQFGATTLPEGAVAVCWIGQSGYLLKTSSGATVLIDPYLSNAAADLVGVERVMPAPFTPEQLVPDVLLITHSDLDHLDVPTVRTYAEAKRTSLAAPLTSVTHARARCGWAADTSHALKPGESVDLGSVRVTATFARHSDADLMTHDSIGFLISVGDARVWHAGDTEYDARLRAETQDVDVAFLPINGSGGNMNAHEAALLAWQIRAGIVVPMHYGMWADEDYTYQGLEPDATLDPDIFVSTYRALGGQGQTVLAEMGEILILSRQQDGFELVPSAGDG